MLFKSIFIASLIICLLAMVGVFVIAQQTDEPTNKKIDVEVSHQDDDFSLRAASYIKRELRSLGDVEVSDYGEWKLYLLGFDAKNVGGRKIGIVLGAVITRRTFDAVTEKLFSKEKPLKDVGADGIAIHVELFHHYSYQGSILYTYGEGDLRRACEEVVTHFDMKHLEVQRSKRNVR